MQERYGWPAERLGAQSATYAFDFVGYQADERTEQIVCEVKPSSKSIDLLLSTMTKHRCSPKEALSDCKAAERNALKKVIALRESASCTFWALGPDNYGYIFAVTRDINGEVILKPTNETALNFE